MLKQFRHDSRAFSSATSLCNKNQESEDPLRKKRTITDLGFLHQVCWVDITGLCLLSKLDTVLEQLFHVVGIYDGLIAR